MTTFAEVVECAHNLSQDEREELVRILQSGLREERRAQILADVEEGRKEYESGACKPASVEEIMRKIRQ
jgi:hypothetical protein